MRLQVRRARLAASPNLLSLSPILCAHRHSAGGLVRGTWAEWRATRMRQVNGLLIAESFVVVYKHDMVDDTVWLSECLRSAVHAPMLLQCVMKDTALNYELESLSIFSMYTVQHSSSTLVGTVVLTVDYVVYMRACTSTVRSRDFLSLSNKNFH